MKYLIIWTIETPLLKLQSKLVSKFTTWRVIFEKEKLSKFLNPLSSICDQNLVATQTKLLCQIFQISIFLDTKFELVGTILPFQGQKMLNHLPDIFHMQNSLPPFHTGISLVRMEFLSKANCTLRASSLRAGSVAVPLPPRIVVAAPGNTTGDAGKRC